MKKNEHSPKVIGILLLQSLYLPTFSCIQSHNRAGISRRYTA